MLVGRLQRFAHRFHDARAVGRLRKHPAHQPAHADDLGKILVGREQDPPRLGMRLRQLAHQLEPAPVRQPHLRHHRIDAVRLEQVERAGPVARRQHLEFTERFGWLR